MEGAHFFQAIIDHFTGTILRSAADLHVTFCCLFVFLVHAGLFDYFADNLPLSDRLGNRSFGSMSCMSVWVLGLYGFARGILMPVLNVKFNGVIN